MPKENEISQFYRVITGDSGDPELHIAVPSDVGDDWVVEQIATAQKNGDWKEGFVHLHKTHEAHGKSFMTFVTAELAGFRKASSEEIEAIIANTNTKIFLRLDVPNESV